MSMAHVSVPGASGRFSPLRRVAAFGSSLALAALLVACGGSETTDPGARQQTLDVVTTVEFAQGQGNFSGAIYSSGSTDGGVTCSDVNANQFPTKLDVYLNGGPRGGGSGIDDGDYWVRVTGPGDGILGVSESATVRVIGGKFEKCYLLWDLVRQPDPSNPQGPTIKGYADTGNGGGVYKIWVSRTSAFDPNQTKFDNFKVGNSPVATTGTLVVKKFYDANGNGIKEDAEPLIESTATTPGWKIGIVFGGFGTVDYTTYTEDLAEPGIYTVTEAKPVQTNWFNTTPTTLVGEVKVGQTTTLQFGNVCLAGGNGRTLGFWSNRNGQALVDGTDYAALQLLKLRTASGGDFEPTSYSPLRTWLLNGTATNMAYMLSVQLAAMKLNTLNKDPATNALFVSPSAVIYAPGTSAANAFGFATVQAVMDAADASLGLNPVVTSGHAERANQEALKNALDNANNSRNFVSPTPCAFTF